MAQTIQQNPLSKEELDTLLRACSDLFAKEIRLTETNIPSKITWPIPNLGKISWANRETLARYIREITGEKKLDAAYAVLYSRWEKATAPEALAPTVPQDIKDLQESYEKEAELRKVEKRKSTAGAKNAQKIWEEKLKKVADAKKQENVLRELKDKKVYAQPKEKTVPPETTPEQKRAFAKLQAQARKNPRAFAKELSKRIIANSPPDLPKDQVEPLAKIVAVDTTQRLVSPEQNPVLPPEVFAAIGNPESTVRNIVSPETFAELEKTSFVFGSITKATELTTRNLLHFGLGPVITDIIYGREGIEYEITPSPTDKTAFEISLPKTQENSFRFQESPLFEALNNPAFDFIKSEASSQLFSQLKSFALTKLESLPQGGLAGKISQFFTSRAFDSVAPFLGIPANMTYVGTNIFGKIITTFAPQYAPLIGNLATKLGIDIGIKAIAPALTQALTTGAVQAAATGTTAAVAGTAGTTAGTATGVGAGAVAGTPLGGPIGAAIGAIVGWIAGKLLPKLISWLQKHKEDLAIIGGVMMAGGLLFRSIPLVVFGALTAIPGLMLARPFAGIAARAFFFGRAIGKSLAITIGTPIIVAIVVFPILVALILFIINSGAYIVPPLSGGPHFESPYIGVKKTANPPGPFQNSELPLTIEYTITITAKKGTLTNIHFSESCQVIKKGASVSCPAVSGSIPQPPDSISPTAPFGFSYSATYPAGTFEDSLVVNSFTVTADTAEASGAKAVGGTSVKIGNPPESCPNNAWPVESGGGLNYVTQGPSAQGCTHQNLNNAIDIGVDGAVVIAVHSGIVTTEEDSCVGKYIKISSTCGSVPFNSYYGHLGAVSVTNGQHVAVGQAIGISDNTGSKNCTTGPHLHFSFQTSSIPTVQRPYLVRDIPVGCCTTSTCNP